MSNAAEASLPLRPIADGPMAAPAPYRAGTAAWKRPPRLPPGTPTPPCCIHQVRLWPAWKCVSYVEVRSHPGTPTPPANGRQVRPLPRLELLSLALQALTSRHTNPTRQRPADGDDGGARTSTATSTVFTMESFQDFVEIAPLAHGAGTVVSCVTAADARDAANKNRDASRKTRGSFTSGKFTDDGDKDSRPDSANGSDTEGRPDSPRQRRQSLKEQWTRSLSFSLIAGGDANAGGSSSEPPAAGAGGSDIARVAAKMAAVMKRVSSEVNLAVG